MGCRDRDVSRSIVSCLQLNAQRAKMSMHNTCSQKVIEKYSELKTNITKLKQ